MSSSLTPAQQQAVAARGNVLVMAGAGTGKTRTLVERCLDCLLMEKPRVSLDELLVVTFTEAAAAEMRERIRARLEQELASHPHDAHWLEQLALFETARIGTLHSFCFQLVRQHFYELELDPQLAVMAEEEARLLAEETLEALLRRYYGAEGPKAEAACELIQSHTRGSDQPIRKLIRKLHEYAQTLPEPGAWFEAQLRSLDHDDPGAWRAWVLQALGDWRERGLALMTAAGADNGVAASCLQILRALAPNPAPAEALSFMSRILDTEAHCPRGKKRAWLKPLSDFFEDSRFLHALLPTGNGSDPLQEDWNWVRKPMRTLLQLAREYGRDFTEAKRELAVLDFHDLEQYALRLLWDPAHGRPSAIAQQWREQLRFVFVDEYQDINAAQDRIIEALSREGISANRFLVGDVKQSIYRFRLANPHIFQRYAEEWRTAGQGQVIPLLDNFRSRREILEFVNSVMGRLMRRELGGITYDEEARLRAGENPRNASATAESAAIELRLRIKGHVETSEDDRQNGEANGAADDFAELEEAAKEARLLAARLKQLHAAQHPVWDQEQGVLRPVEWRDMAVLLRAPSAKAEHYAKEFARLQVPLHVARGGFYSSIEISDLLSLLQILDNPLQDLPVLAVLRGPFVGLGLEQLAEIRLALPRGHFWNALLRWQEKQKEPEPAGDRGTSQQLEIWDASRKPEAQRQMLRKVDALLANHARWRRLARQVSLSRCLEMILAETGYVAWAQAQDRGAQRHENIKRLLVLTQRFDQLQRQGLFRFLRFIEAQQEAQTEPETAAVSMENAVRLMSIHQSKGLEFPVVAVADLGKAFNVSDLRADIILDDEFGLCPRVQAPGVRNSYPSLPHWMASRRQKHELLGEEVRLLYVAMTRARDLLLLSGSISRSSFEKRWRRAATVAERPERAGCFLDWLGPWFVSHAGSDSPWEGQNHLLRWQIHDDGGVPDSAGDFEPMEQMAQPEVDRLPLVPATPWHYPFELGTRIPAKTTVSALRRQALASLEDENAVPWKRDKPFPRFLSSKLKHKATAAEVGEAHHTFLQFVDLAQTETLRQLETEADRMNAAGLLEPAEVKLLDFSALARFWQSDLGRQIRKQASCVRREVPFTFRLPAAEFARRTGETTAALDPNDFVVVQGVPDLAAVLPEEIWLVDFKTEAVEADLEASVRKYEGQLELYSLALASIHRRPVTRAWLHFFATGQTVEALTANRLSESPRRS